MCILGEGLGRRQALDSNTSSTVRPLEIGEAWKIESSIIRKGVLLVSVSEIIR